MPDVRTNHVNAYQSTLAAQVGPTGMTATVTAVGSLAAPCYLVFEPDSSSQREYFTVSAINGNILTISARYRAGSAAGSGLTHAAGTVVRMVADAAMFEDLHDRIDADAAAFDSHHGGTSTLDHPEATTGTRGFMSAADKTNIDAFATAHRNHGGTEHAVATTSVAGFLSAADKTKLDNLGSDIIRKRAASSSSVEIGAATSGSPVTALSVTLAIPAGWSTYDVEAHCTVQVSNSVPGTSESVFLKLLFGASALNGFGMELQPSGNNVVPVVLHSSGFAEGLTATGNIVAKADVYMSNYVANIDIVSRVLIVTAYRTS